MIEGFFPHPLSLANQGQLKWHTTVIQSLQNDLNRVSNRDRVSAACMLHGTPGSLIMRFLGQGKSCIT